MNKLILRCSLSPGDVLTMTTAVEALVTLFPNQYIVDVRTPVPDIWENNPHITPIADNDAEACRIEMQYPSIDSSGTLPITFANGYTRFLAAYLGVRMESTTNRPHLYLSDEEKSWINQVRQNFTDGRDVPYWIVNAGIKSDFTAKAWPIEHYQDVVNSTRGNIQWVQIGEAGHNHPKLDGVIDLRGKTTCRELIRLVYHSQGGLGPVTFLQHLCAAWEKPYLCLLGGREDLFWTSYPRQHTFHTIGLLDCCRHGGCWKSRVVKLNDGDSKDDDLCQHPIVGLQRAAGRCMAMIQPSEIVGTLERILAS